MGLLRFVLSIAVMLSHSGVMVLGLNPGVMSVVVFYAISGFVMSALIERHYDKAADTHYFYLDRLARIYPQYLFYAAATALWLFTIGHPTHYLHLHPQVAEWWNNLLIVPLNYYMYNGSDRFTLVPPAWSLGAELLFYVFAPWLWRHWVLAIYLALASLLVQVLAWHGILHSDWWGYRLLPGVLWVFVLGMALQRLQKTSPARARQLSWITPLVAAGVAAYLYATGMLMRPYHREVLMGLGLGIPLIQQLTQVFTAITHRYRKTDQWLGDLSYGIFLNHFLLIWWLNLPASPSVWQWTALIAFSTLLSALSQRFIEQPILHWRRVLRHGKTTP
jgi:peptidoglycan/LPS O-acetylase OafA/YrhL